MKNLQKVTFNCKTKDTYIKGLLPLMEKKTCLSNVVIANSRHW